MKLILQKDVKNLGKAGDQVTVKTGYARNFLIPNEQALPVNKDRLKVWKHQKVIIEAKKRKAVAERKALIEKLSSIKLQFERESLVNGKLFGSVTAHEISQALEKLHNIYVDKRDISFDALKIAGDHTITIALDSEHKTNIVVNIDGKITKKKMQQSEPSSSSKPEKSNETLEDKSEKSDETLEDKSEKSDETLEDKPEKSDETLEDKPEKSDETLEDKPEKSDETPEDKLEKSV